MSTATIRAGARVAGYPALPTPASEGLRMSDVAQRMWQPLLAMGAMVILAGIALGIVSATHADDYFGLTAATIAAAPAGGAIADDRSF
jgi:hypothetical protein